ncbi:hypothetical protein [Actinoplanes sp. NBRC 103695]|uniref:hypothetical protein n=1 Tax=Actinoplanes sp. NBRC 103695 TaxID=3032202 RepID=UPI0024A4311E|nr:hypothetical protein [Actinoplanes sp. NBRC 103695]GLY93266.1 hypothetical protein Acsp02_05220 [Actinoplanes sp. NBRC 103695]
MTGTRRLVLRLWLGALAATLVTLTGAVVAIELGRRDAEALRGGEAPAREGLAAARQALVEADSKAVGQFPGSPDGTPATGPGEAYREAIATAGRQLAQVSQADLGGPAAESVQVVNGLLSTYDALIDQAFRETVDPALNLAYLQYAHHLLDEEILPQLATLQGEVDQAQPASPGSERHVLWVAPLVVLAGLLGWAQVTLASRFRRTLSAPLLAASLLAAGLAVTATLSRDADGDVAAGRATLAALVGDYRTRETRIRSGGCDALSDASREWGDPDPVCPPDGPAPATDRELLRKANEVSMTAQDATAVASRGIVLVIVLSALIALLVTLGLLPRVEEYRFRRR